MHRDEAATRLEQDHRDVAQALARLLDFAKAGDEELVREEWDAVEARILAHMDAEEMYLLPGFERDQPADAAAIRKAHDAIRRVLGESGVAVDLHLLRAENIADLCRRLVEHIDAERSSLYPWARAKGDSDSLRLLLRQLHPAARPRDRTASTLYALLQACRDGERGYRAAASDVPDGGYQLMFAHYANERAAFAARLDDALRALGAIPVREGSALGALHRGWLDTKATVTGGDPKVVLGECLRGEDAALKAYRVALRAGLPPSVREVVQEQYEGVKKAHAEVAALAGK